jgi:hypothetical protein
VSIEHPVLYRDKAITFDPKYYATATATATVGHRQSKAQEPKMFFSNNNAPGDPIQI